LGGRRMSVMHGGANDVVSVDGVVRGSNLNEHRRTEAEAGRGAVHALMHAVVRACACAAVRVVCVITDNAFRYGRWHEKALRLQLPGSSSRHADGLLLSLVLATSLFEAACALVDEQLDEVGCALVRHDRRTEGRLV
jgi:hypothetical protein